MDIDKLIDKTITSADNYVKSYKTGVIKKYKTNVYENVLMLYLINNSITNLTTDQMINISNMYNLLIINV